MITARRVKSGRRREVRYLGSLAGSPRLEWNPSEWNSSDLNDGMEWGFYAYVPMASVPSAVELTISIETRGDGWWATLHGPSANDFVGREVDVFARGSLMACMIAAEDYVRRIQRAERRQGKLFEEGGWR